MPCGARDLPESPEQFLGDAPGAEPAQMPEPGTTVVLDVPGLLADHLEGTRDTAVRKALRGGRTVRRGQGYSVRVTASLALHRAVLEQRTALADRPPLHHAGVLQFRNRLVRCRRSGATPLFFGEYCNRSRCHGQLKRCI